MDERMKSEEYAKDMTDVLIDDIEAAFVKAGIKISRGDVAMLTAFAVATAKDISFTQKEDIEKDDEPMSLEDVKKAIGETDKSMGWGDSFWWVMMLLLIFAFAPGGGPHRNTEGKAPQEYCPICSMSNALIRPPSDKEQIAYLSGKVEAYEKTMIGG